MGDTQTGHDETRDRRIGQIIDGYLDRRAQGTAEPEADLLARHLDLADELRSHLELIRHLRPDQSDLESLLAQGILEPCDDPHYPAKLGEYKIRQFIGRGGMGVVLEAYEQSLDRKVALKVLRPELGEDQSAVARFTREAKAAAALRHPNIVTIHAVGQERGVHYLAMEYIEGPTLANLIRQGWSTDTVAAGAPAGREPPVAADLRVGRSADIHLGPLPTEFIRDVFRQLLSALATAHDAGLIHRDVKSSNILLEVGSRKWEVGTKNGEAGTSRSDDEGDSAFRIPPSALVKLADFGLARMLSAKTRITVEGSTLGTPEYMSPEQARGDEAIDHRTDLYSAGVVLYEMLTGRTPFKADTPSAVIHRIIHEEPVDPRTINKDADPHLTSLALRLMAKRPEDRFGSAPQSIAAMDASVPIRSPRRLRRPYRPALVGVLLTVLVCGFLWLTTPHKQGPRHPVSDAWAYEPISDVRPARDHLGSLTTDVEVQVGDSLEWRRFYRFPAEAERVTGAILVNADGRARQVVVAGLQNAINGDCVFAFDPRRPAAPERKPEWTLGYRPDSPWPDCDRVRVWNCRVFAKGELNGEPGDELVVVISDPHDYPTCLSIVDPRDGGIVSTYWHMGYIHGARILPGFFDDKRPAIIAWGQNNKLDGFNEHEERDGVPFSRRRWANRDDAMVSAVMILDPEKMEGLGPPPTFRIEIAPARPYAYAFLDMPPNDDVHLADTNGVARAPAVHEIGRVADVQNADDVVTDNTRPWFELTIKGQAEGQEIDVTALIVNRHLELEYSSSPMGGRTRQAEGVWLDHWHPIIQNGGYVEAAAGWAAQPKPPA